MFGAKCPDPGQLREVARRFRVGKQGDALTARRALAGLATPVRTHRRGWRKAFVGYVSGQHRCKNHFTIYLGGR
jgi:hypothetical protein